MSETSDLHIMLGEIRGQLREMIHTTNNTASKVDALGREVSEIKGIAVTVAALDVRVTKLEGKVSTLTTSEDKRTGATSLAEWIVKIMPWAVMGVVFALAAKLIGLSP